MIEWICSNKEWLFSGAGLTFLLYLCSLIYGNYKQRKQKSSNVSENNSEHINSSDSLNVTKNITKSTNWKKNSLPKSKESINILFIDDQNFNVINVLKKAGWKHTALKHYIKAIDDDDIVSAHIIFVDIQGVCKDLFTDEGLGLANALKTKYPMKKIVLYSAKNEGNRFDKTLRLVDACLSKNAEVYEFMQLVDDFAQQIWNEES